MIAAMAAMVGERKWRARLLWLSMVLAPVVVSVAANRVLNDGVWSGPWLAGTIVAAVVAGLIVERAGRVLAPAAGTVTETMRELARLVHDRWSDEVVTRSLGDPPIPISGLAKFPPTPSFGAEIWIRMAHL